MHYLDFALFAGLGLAVILNAVVAAAADFGTALRFETRFKFTKRTMDRLQQKSIQVIIIEIKEEPTSKL